MMAYLAVFAVVGWLAGSTALYYFIKNRSGYTDVRYAHIVGLPWTLNSYRHAKGEFWLKEGMADAAEGRWRQAFDRLRQGLPFMPENEEARLTLARIYLMAGRPDLARPVLVEGLPHHTDQTTYLRTVIGFLFGQQADAAVVEMADGLLAQGHLTGEARRMVAASRLYALFNRDQFDQIPDALAMEELGRSVEGRFIQARMAWETGAPEAALIMLRDLHERAPQDAEIYRTLIYYLRESGRPDEARRVALARQWARPDSPEGYVDYISLITEEGNKARAAEAQDTFLTQFADKPAELLTLAAWAAREGEAALAWRIAERCPPKSAEAAAATLLALEAELKRGAYRAALDRLAEVQTQAGLPWNMSQQLALLGMQGAAQLGVGLASEAQANFNRIATASAMAPTNLTAIAAHVEKLGDSQAAGRLLRRALELDPIYQPALVALLRLELKEQALDGSLDLVRRLPELRKPPGELMSAIVQNLESDRYLFVTERSATINTLQAKLDAVGYTPRS